jgi:GNAT superfamily N-acetyltransferase
MEISVRLAVQDDIPRILDLYRAMEEEQIQRKPIWALTDGFDEPFEDSLAHAMTTPDSWVFVGEIDAVVVAFVWALVQPMLGRASGERIGRLQLIYTDPEARGIGVGHELAETALSNFRSLGLRHFEAPVGPGQRAAKNFFEGHKFAARSIIMYSMDRDQDV